MTTLMSGDDIPMGRVLPKVFADVPSAEELKQAQEMARRARARAAGLLLVSVLLAGALLAAIIFIVVSMNSSPSGDLVAERDNALKEVTRLKGEETRLTGDVTKAQAATEAVRTQFAVYSQVAILEAAVSTRREEVRKLIEQAPNANETNIRDVSGWNAYKGRTNWPAYQNTGDWKTYIGENLQRQLTSLDGLETKIDAFIRGAGTPVIVTRPCTPSTPGFPQCG